MKHGLKLKCGISAGKLLADCAVRSHVSQMHSVIHDKLRLRYCVA